MYKSIKLESPGTGERVGGLRRAIMEDDRSTTSRPRLPCPRQRSGHDSCYLTGSEDCF